MFLSFLQEFKDINVLLQSSFEEEHILTKITEKLSKIANSNLLLIDKDGYLLQELLIENFSLTYKNYFTNQIRIEEQIITQLNDFNNLKLNITLDNLCTSLSTKNELKKYYSILYPIIINNYKISYLILYKKEPFDNNIELILRHIEPIISIILHYKTTEKIIQKENNKNIVKSAISTLSYSELDAIIHIFNEMDKDEGVIIASKVADKFNITRSVIVNALRKFESAGIFETRSLGMKGTYIKVLNPQFICEINKLKK